MLLLAAAVQLAHARELKYPAGLGPGDLVSGTDGEFFRYKHVLVKPPDDDDRMESLRMAEDIKCKACELLLQGLLRRAESKSEDHIMDQLDGELRGPVELLDDAQENRVNQNRKGCNKHFKDELLLRGWMVQRCPQPDGAKVTPQEGGGAAKGKPARPDRRAEWCLEQRSRPPPERDVDTYSTWNEAAFYACENTVGRYGQELAAFMAERLEAGGDLVADISAACHEAARCQGAQRKRAGAAKAVAGGRRQRRRRRRGGAAEL